MVKNAYSVRWFSASPFLDQGYASDFVIIDLVVNLL